MSDGVLVIIILWIYFEFSDNISPFIWLSVSQQDKQSVGGRGRVRVYIHISRFQAGAGAAGAAAGPGGCFLFV